MFARTANADKPDCLRGRSSVQAPHLIARASVALTSFEGGGLSRFPKDEAIPASSRGCLSRNSARWRRPSLPASRPRGVDRNCASALALVVLLNAGRDIRDIGKILGRAGPDPGLRPLTLVALQIAPPGQPVPRRRAQPRSSQGLGFARSTSAERDHSKASLV
jgi:hypothetical protein